MQGIVVCLFCLVASASAFLPVAPICRNAGSKVATSQTYGRSREFATRPLSMGFDFKGMMEKMSDSRYARVRHILVDEKGEAARERLEAVKEEIDGDLDKFSEQAIAISTCTSAPKGGRLKLLARAETVPEFDDVCFNKEIGVVHGPVETEFGTHLIYVESCNKPQNTWKMLADDVVKKIKGEEGGQLLK